MESSISGVLIFFGQDLSDPATNHELVSTPSGDGPRARLSSRNLEHRPSGPRARPSVNPESGHSSWPVEVQVSSFDFLEDVMSRRPGT